MGVILCGYMLRECSAWCFRDVSGLRQACAVFLFLWICLKRLTLMNLLHLWQFVKIIFMYIALLKFFSTFLCKRMNTVLLSLIDVYICACLKKKV